MNKSNLDKLFDEEDHTLVDLLRTSTLIKPSSDFVDNALNRWDQIKGQNRTPYKPLRTPLYLMGMICLIMIIPIALSSPDMPIPSIDISRGIDIKIDPWYAYSIVLLLLVPMTWFQWAIAKYKQPL